MKGFMATRGHLLLLSQILNMLFSHTRVSLRTFYDVPETQFHVNYKIFLTVILVFLNTVLKYGT